ncbi:DoxX family protein [Streptomyces sp. NPDC012403]|uniref:DoxX family protein n=1 Tax=unclassified Streptomyces TaxID=2593676 RepID=UPI0034538E96
MNIVLTVVTVFFGGFFLAGGTGQLLGRWPEITPAAACGFSPQACRVIGLLELLGGAGLLAASFAPAVGIAAALFLFPVTGSAFVHHSWYQERGFRLVAPIATACVMLCVAAGLYLTRMG